MRDYLAVCALTLAACTAKEPTEIVAGVSTQIQVPDYLRAVGLVVQAEGEVIFCDAYPVTDGTTTLPATLGVLGAAGAAPRGTVTVQVLGMRTEVSQFDQDCVFTRSEAGEPNNREVMVIRRRRLSFIDGRILYLPLPLKESCRDEGCGPEETCVGGRCVSADIDSNTLPDYQERLLYGTTNTCFDGDFCMPSGGTLPPLLEDPSTCTFRLQWPSGLPAPSAGDLNVRLFYDTFGTEILDEDNAGLGDDQREGFSFPSPDDPLTFRLAPNLCQSNYQAERVLAVEASALCPAKRSLQPVCESYDPPNPRAKGNGRAGAADPSAGAGICTLAALEPVESAVYVLMDRSRRMYPFYGDGGLRFAVELPLSSPVARRTRIAFGPLPATAAECGTTAYTAPQIPFGSVTEVRQPIADVLSTLASVLPDNPAEVFLAAALQGAYAAVSSTPSLGGDGFGQRAVVVISNRDISAGACAGPTAVELATAAAAGPTPVKTYAVALGDPNEDDPAADASTVASATALATAGGSQVFNGVADGAEGATAVLDILTELGTCLYRVNRVDLGSDGANALPDTATVSYVDPLSPSTSAVDIALNPDCRIGAPAAVSGWNREGERVRVCGQACTDLRSVISNVTSLHLLEERSAPPVPVVVSAPCGDFVLRSGS